MGFSFCGMSSEAPMLTINTAMMKMSDAMASSKKNMARRPKMAKILEKNTT